MTDDADAYTLAAVLDEIVPPSDDGRFPGAGEIGLAGYVEEALRATPALVAMVAESLSALERLARDRHARAFVALTRPERSAVLDALASSEHAFPPVLVIHTFASYYHHPRILAALGMEPRPPHPQGYAMEPGDLGLLDPVRRRSKLYRAT